MEIKSPKKTSPVKIGRHSAKKVYDKNKKFINEGQYVLKLDIFKNCR